jgi:hypothetical protein
MKIISATVWLCALGAAASAQFAPTDVAATRSVSGQFVVYSPRQTLPVDSVPDLATNAQWLHFESALLAVSCERIKQALWRELGAVAPWRGRIDLVLHPAQSAAETITVVSTGFTDGWNYRIELPDTVERARFIRTVVQVLLLEYANRNAGAHPAEIPAWLAAGLSQQLAASPEIELVLTPPRRTVNGLAVSHAIFQGRKPDPLEPARQQLREQPPLTLEQLSWPEEPLTGVAGDTYRASAQLFVDELLQLKNGRACLRAMLEELPQCYNWQTAFLRAFRPHFERLLDVEKWWALQVAHFTGREHGQTWTLEESWNKLDEILGTPVQVRASAGELPVHADVPLPTVVRDWDSASQTQTLQSKLHDLESARLRVPKELAGLVDEYHRVLATYLQRREQAESTHSANRQPNRILQRVVDQTFEQLNALEARRQALRPEPDSTSAAESGTDPTPAP